MAPAQKDSLKARVLTEARALIMEEGLGQLTFDQLAARLGVTKQAILYWYPSKSVLLVSVALPGLKAEADCAINIARVGDRAASAPGPVAERLYTGLVAFHLADLDRFRLIYLAAQFAGPADHRMRDAAREVHPVTSAMYDAMEQALGGGAEARRHAVGLHFSALGVATMAALTETIGDPLLHPPERIAKDMSRVFARGMG